jgi:hypothetical protein
MSTLHAPWPPETVVQLNRYQRSGWHPYTCGNERMDFAHRTYQERFGGDFGSLIATQAGWICPVCKYTQNWADEVLLRMVGKMPAVPPDPFEQPPCGPRPVSSHYCIYNDKTSDHSGKFVLRRWDIYEGVGVPIPGVARLADSHAELRTLIKDRMSEGCCLQRAANDDPTILEVWI